MYKFIYLAVLAAAALVNLLYAKDPVVAGVVMTLLSIGAGYVIHDEFVHRPESRRRTEEAIGSFEQISYLRQKLTAERAEHAVADGDLHDARVVLCYFSRIFRRFVFTGNRDLVEFADRVLEDAHKAVPPWPIPVEEKDSMLTAQSTGYYYPDVIRMNTRLRASATGASVDWSSYDERLVGPVDQEPDLMDDWVDEERHREKAPAPSIGDRFRLRDTPYEVTADPSTRDRVYTVARINSNGSFAGSPPSGCGLTRDLRPEEVVFL